MTASWRFSALADRHRALGSNLEDWSGMGTAWTYDKDQEEEYIAIRTKAGVMDVSGANTYMVVHGSGAGHEQLTMAAAGRDVSIRFDDNLHDISLQGPLSVDFLEKHVDGIRQLPYFGHMPTRLFGHMPTRLFGHPVTISRTGYTGERGYEIFCRGQDAPDIWDTIVEQGASMGIIPTRFTTLDLLRAESYLLFYPYDNSETYPFENEGPGDTLWELGLDFTVSEGKVGFRGAEEHYRLKGKERFKIYGLILDGEEPAEEGAPLMQDGKQVGVATIGMYSSLQKHNVAIARMPVDCATPGTALQVKNSTGLINCKAAAMPFYDVDKSRRTVKG